MYYQPLCCCESCPPPSVPPSVGASDTKQILTNTQEGYSSIEYQIYTAPQTDHDANAKDRGADADAGAGVGVVDNNNNNKAPPTIPWAEERRAILVELRRRGALAQSAAVQKKICVFGGFGQAEEYMNELRWPLALSGRLDVSSLGRPGPDAKMAVTNQNIYGMFLSAVEESLSITLGNMCRAIRVGHMSWIVPTDGQDDHLDAAFADVDTEAPQEYSLLTLRTQITNLGSILLLPEVVSTNFRTVSSATDDAKSLLLAPSGTLASVADDISSLSLRDAEPDGVYKGRRQMRSEARARLARQAKEDKWKASVKSRLGHCTAVPEPLNDTTTWTKVRVPNPRSSAATLQRPTWERARPAHSCLWPTKLCFEKWTAREALDESDMDWIKAGTYQDPLTAAEQWYTGKSKRDEDALQVQERVDQEAEEDLAATQPADVPADHVTQSSPLNIRTHDQTNTNGIYPTPPDGILPAIFAETLPSTSAAEDAGPPTVTEDYTLTRPSSNTSAPDLALTRKNSTDALFDDMDEEMFGAADVDVTDADFNFFDDTDPHAPHRRRSSNRVADASSILPTSQHAKRAEHDGTEVVDGPLTAPPTASDHVAKDVDENRMDAVDGFGAPESDHGDMTGASEHLVDGTSLPALVLPQKVTPEQSEERLRTPPLSPFQIKERFMPSPVPASTIRGQSGPHDSLNARRSSTFNPVVFKGNIDSFDAKYRDFGRFHPTQDLPRHIEPPTPSLGRSSSIIDLPPRKKLIPRSRRIDSARQSSAQTPAILDITEDTSSDESDTDSASSTSSSSSGSGIALVAAAASSSAGKRKRLLADDGASINSPRGLTDNESDVESAVSDDKSVVDYAAILDMLLSRDAQRDNQKGAQDSQHRFGERQSGWKDIRKDRPRSADLENEYWDVFDFTQEDLIGVAQLVAQQSIDPQSNQSHRRVHDQFDISDTSLPGSCGPSLTATYSAAHDAIKHVFSIATDCDFGKLAAVISFHADHTQAAKNVPRPNPTPRRPHGASSAGAQHLFAIQPPPVHLQRSGASWEMLPSSLEFWESLSLEPANGPKDVVSYAIYPESGDFAEGVEDFLDNIARAYENCKLGTHVRGPTYTEYRDGLVGFPLPENPSTRNVLQCIRTASVAFGDVLRDEATFGADKAVIVYMFTPTPDEVLTKYLCGCFWAMQQALAQDPDSSDDPLPDFILQIVPTSHIATPHRIAFPDPIWLNDLAHQVYDRVPLRTAADPKSHWAIPSAPSIQLSHPAPRKINFLLHEKPPKSLLEEAQVLHVAYATSADNSWLTAAWTDNTGHYQFSTSFWTRDTDGKAILSEVRDMTLALARNSTFRIFVARVGTLRNWEKEVWREHPSDSYSITLLDVDPSPPLHISATDTSANHPAVSQPGGGGVGFLTPASTPQAANFTVSPEASTPAALEEQSQPPDQDAYLIDTTDETWGLVLPFSAVHGPYDLKRSMASGLLLKRGGGSESDGLRQLPSLGVDVIDVLMPRVVEGQPTWLGLRSTDTLLREVLSWYRGLGMLTRLRGLDRWGSVPWHVGVAVRGAEALEGFLD